jgi:NitT/TauT family transport system ATP-binding protein
MKISNLNKSFGKNVIFENFNIEFSEGKINYIMGKSGVGKTTLLSILAGLDKDYTGEIDIRGKIAYVFQEPRLFPTISVTENIRIVNEASQKDPKIFLSYVDLVGCEEMMPEELSGGMKMRVAIARALYYDADVILMDEPFSAIDKDTKEKVAKEVFNVLRGKTVIVISHDEDNAKAFADNILYI